MLYYRKLILLVIILLPSAIYSQERTIKIGDIIEVVITGNEALSQTVIVSHDGTVDYPALQGLPVDGITLQRFQKILISQLSRYLETTPLVLVRFSDSYPIKVTVLGQVANPGVYSIANTATLQGAISAAGSFIPGAQLSKIKLIRTEGKQKNSQVVNMEIFYREGDPSFLPLLKDEDTIVVPGNPLATNVKVLGSVENPGSYQVFFQTTLLDVIFLAGGPTADANLSDIKIVSLAGQGAREVKMNIKELMKSNNFQNIPIVVPGDVVYVGMKKITWKKFINVVRDISTMAAIFTVYLLYRRVEMR